MNSSLLLTNSVTIIIALIAGIIAIYQVKLNVISNSRIKWIENLRDTVSEYCAEVTRLSTEIGNFADKTKKLSPESPQYEKILQEYYLIYVELTVKTDKLKNRIQLYLNTEEEDHKNIEKYLVEISTSLHKGSVYKLDCDKIDDQLKMVIYYSKNIFKKEWSKSKRLFKS